MELTEQAMTVPRGEHRLHAEVTPGDGVPIVLMHGFPDNIHLYDRLLPHLTRRDPVVRFDFLGWGRSDKPDGYPYTATNQAGDVEAVVEAAASDSALTRWCWSRTTPRARRPSTGRSIPADRVAGLVLLNTYYHWTPWLRRPPAIALYSTPVLRAVRGRCAGAPTWIGASTPGRWDGSSAIRSCGPSTWPCCTSSSVPPARRSGGSTTTCSVRCSAVVGGSRRCGDSRHRCG